jgi:hypothetical protein
MTKYAPLTRHLSARNQPRVAMRFDEVEALLGFSLPPSARKYRAWWSNNPRNSVMTKAWLAAGYRSRDVDLAAERLIFERLNSVEAAEWLPDHPLWGWAVGTVTMAPGTDLTAPLFTDAELDVFDERTMQVLEGWQA